MVVFGKKWLLSGTSFGIREKVVVFEQSCCIWAKMVVFRQSVCIVAKGVVFKQ